MFEVDNDQYQLLRARECGYQTMTTTVRDWFTKSSYDVVTFIDEPCVTYDFVHNDPAQEDYLEICIQGARRYGDQFLQNFVDSTYINEQSLAEYLATNTRNIRYR
jgi:hypothetical protein